MTGADDMFVRNSRILAVFDEILHGPEGSLRAVEIAGRGIAAEMRCVLATLADKTDTTETADAPSDPELRHALAYADRLIELGDIEDDLVELWRGRRNSEIDDRTFESTLKNLVVRLEQWPERRLVSDPPLDHRS